MTRPQAMIPPPSPCPKCGGATMTIMLDRPVVCFYCGEVRADVNKADRR